MTRDAVTRRSPARRLLAYALPLTVLGLGFAPLLWSQQASGGQRPQGEASKTGQDAAAGKKEQTGKKQPEKSPEKTPAKPAQPAPGPGDARTFPGLEQAGELAKQTNGDIPKASAPLDAWILLEAKEALVLRDFQSKDAHQVAGPYPKGTLFWTRSLDDQYGFLRLALPGGFPGYVHAKYLAVSEDGYGRATGDDVSFRYRPRPKEGEAPVDQLRSGTRLPVLEREGDWWRVLSSDEVGAWGKAAALRELARAKAGEAAPKIEAPELTRRLAEQIDKFQAPWIAAREKIKDEGAKAILEQDWSGLRKALDTIDRKINQLEVEKHPILQKLAFRKSELKRVELLQEVYRITEAKPKKGPQPVESSVKVPAKRRYTEAGWLEFRPGIHDYSPFQLRKGGRMLFYVTCSSGRYDLSDYKGRELGLRGEISRPQSAGIRV
ncbi:MAG: hypothetical protein ACE5F1_23275, partial [Planctomycetota bacterium]